MAQPQAYDRIVDFTERDGDDTNHAGINSELDAAALSINQIRQNLALIQKDDGALQNGIVGADQLAPSAFDALQASLDEATQEAQNAAQSALTSALTATQAASDAANSMAVVQQAETASLLNAQNALASATAAQANAGSAATSAANASTSASTASTSATNAANSAGAAAASAASAANSASTATTQAGIATTEAGNASASALAASTSSINAANSASAASTSESNAANFATSAANSASAAAASAASIDSENLVRVFGDQTVDGTKTFTSPPVVPAGSWSLDRLESVHGFRILGNLSAASAPPEALSIAQFVAANQGIFKLDPNSACFVKTGPNALAVKAFSAFRTEVNVITFAADTPVTMPTLTAGEDYAIWARPDGTLQATPDPFSSPAAPPVAGARKIGGFHYGLVAPGTTPAGGSFATTGFTNQGGSMIWTQAMVDRIAGINEFSLWDLAWRCKGQQRGMALDPQAEVWHAIYFCSVNHIVNGISRNNTDVASGTVLPRIPLAYGGNGSTNYGRFSQYECEEVAASFGLRLPTPDEFRSAMFGVTEAQSLGGSAVTIPLTTRQPGYTSRIGIEQATGHEWIFARGNSAAGGSAWITGPNRGDAYGNPWVILLGGSRDYAANSGSRASSSYNVAWNSGWIVALRAAGDHLKHV